MERLQVTLLMCASSDVLCSSADPMSLYSPLKSLRGIYFGYGSIDRDVARDRTESGRLGHRPPVHRAAIFLLQGQSRRPRLGQSRPETGRGRRVSRQRDRGALPWLSDAGFGAKERRRDGGVFGRNPVPVERSKRVHLVADRNLGDVVCGRHHTGQLVGESCGSRSSGHSSS